MSLIEITKDCYLYNSKNIEMVSLISSIFFDEGNKRYLEFYNLEFIEEIKKKYRFLHEILNELKYSGMPLLEFLFNRKDLYNNQEINCLFNDDSKSEFFLYDSQKLNFPINDFENLVEYEKYLLDMEADIFFYKLFSEDIDKDIIKAAIHDSYKLSELYEKNNYITKSFIGLKTLIDNREMFIRDFFSCARALQGTEFENGIEYINNIFDDERKKFEKSIGKEEPLEVSQQIMGKTFKNRGPYKKFIFIPSVFSPYKAMRFFYDYQALIYSIGKNEFTNTDAINKLKAISDESRLKIIEILRKSGPMIGVDLAKNLNIANSTLSHHIEQLSTAGLLNEERVKNSKYYSINTNSLDDLIKYLSELFKE
ncbi:winged helix-turn-helix transcriptional regulator [Sedimentibacter hydroxybenzoicus DSM 7310]|uniref:Winged helix-turn-helix transcriptional regulator n=1 Tax=Sedimentibacter hydroxybenzoicus DSM 7310 TaxID=1123245 RepID=A0A974BGX9_SEDHY|nr:metalloregulator ArsR/SmtB family transcription factor [Sedimentibacter hydroxybenzoicus]NYB72948.1 winged helix-turn-helix transcriptional regulator [Sedimentibacter hydroxybenzoicus DSM 7310]